MRHRKISLWWNSMIQAAAWALCTSTRSSARIPIGSLISRRSNITSHANIRRTRRTRAHTTCRRHRGFTGASAAPLRCLARTPSTIRVRDGLHSRLPSRKRICGVWMNQVRRWTQGSKCCAVDAMRIWGISSAMVRSRRDCVTASTSLRCGLLRKGRPSEPLRDGVDSVDLLTCLFLKATVLAPTKFSRSWDAEARSIARTMNGCAAMWRLK